VLAFYVMLIAFALRHDVVLAQVVLRNFAKGLFAFDFAVVEFSAEPQVPVLSDFLGFGEALFFRAGAAVLAGEIRGALPKVAVRTLVMWTLPPRIVWSSGMWTPLRKRRREMR
jgi:hypothetical protein